MLRKTAAVLVLALVVISSALACYCIYRCDPVSASLAGLRPAGLYCLGDGWPSRHTQGSFVLLEFRYHIGMTRDAIQKNFAFDARLVASDSRPDKDWKATRSGQSGLACYVLEFERGLCSGLVAACDVYDDGRAHHVLFFDDAGVLVGAQQFPSFICLSACADSANKASSADGTGHGTAEFCC